MMIQNGGTLRLRGDPSKNHTSTGSITMEDGTSFKYNTSGTGMYINAPIIVNGAVSMIMESGNSSGSTMTLAGPVSGSSTITALNNGKDQVNNGTLLLTGNNSGFIGIWDLTKYSTRFPSTAGYITYIEGESENAFGKGVIIAGLEN